eukprot:11121136-Alexandrium_andersonii.AAC.1
MPSPLGVPWLRCPAVRAVPGVRSVQPLVVSGCSPRVAVGCVQTFVASGCSWPSSQGFGLQHAANIQCWLRP